MTTRTRLSVLLAILATLALALTSCGGDGGGGGGGQAGEAGALLERAFKKQADSGELKFDLKADLDGVDQLKGPLSLSLKGPFKSNGPKRLPILDWDITAGGAGQRVSGGLIVTKDNAFVDFQGQPYEVGTDAFRQLAQSYSQQQGGAPSSLRALGADPASWLEDPKIEDGDDIGGDSTRRVTGSVDVRKVVKDLLDVARSPALRRQLERQGRQAPPPPEVTDADIDKIEKAIDDLEFEVDVDDSGMARRLFAEARFTVPKDSGAGSLKGGKLSFSYVLEKVGTEPDVKAPSGAKPLSQLLLQFGLGGALGSGGLGAQGGLSRP